MSDKPKSQNEQPAIEDSLEKPEFQIRFISYEECFNLGNYENRKIKLGYDINKPEGLHSAAAEAFYQIHLIHKVQCLLKKADDDLTRQREANQVVKDKRVSLEQRLVEHQAKVAQLTRDFPDKPHKANCAMDTVEETEKDLQVILDFLPEIETNITQLKIYYEKLAEFALAGEFEKAMELETVERIPRPDVGRHFY